MDIYDYASLSDQFQTKKWGSFTYRRKHSGTADLRSVLIIGLDGGTSSNFDIRFSAWKRA